MNELIALTLIAGIVSLSLGVVAFVAHLRGCEEDGITFAVHCALGCFGAFTLGMVLMIAVATR